MQDFCVYFRCFTGMGYWGSFKLTKAYNQEHANRKLERIQKAYFLIHGQIGQFMIEPISGDRLKIVAGGLGCRLKLTPTVVA